MNIETKNTSTIANDSRSVRQIVYEKAVFGATPVQFQLSTDAVSNDWHTIHWIDHPHLSAVKFSDGSVVEVNQEVASADEAQRLLSEALTPTRKKTTSAQYPDKDKDDVVGFNSAVIASK
jgi:hypothetical protein